MASWGRSVFTIVLVYAFLANVLVYVYASAGMQPPSFLMLYPAVRFGELVSKLNSTATVEGVNVSGSVVAQVHQGWQMVVYSIDVWGFLVNFALNLVWGLPPLFFELAKAANELLGAPLGPQLMYLASAVGAVLQGLANFYLAYSIAGALGRVFT